MSDLRVTGVIKSINQIEKGQSKAGKEWQKQTFVIDTGEKFNPEVCFQVFGAEKCENLTKYNKVGDNVEVCFNVSSREFNGKYYHNLDAWKVSKMEGMSTAPAPANVDAEGVDDLPF